MVKTAIDKNIAYSEKFIQNIDNPKVPKDLRDIFIEKKTRSLIDLGCGDGGFISALKKEFPEIKIVGIDISPRRINGLIKKFPEDDFYLRDVCDTKLKNKFDFVYSSQVIEHVENDSLMIKEIKRLLNPSGLVYVSSVIKKPWAVYQYRNNGKFVLDPTHEREYKNPEEFSDLFKKSFKLIKFKVDPVRMPKFGLSIRIPGYYIIEGIWEKRK